MTVLRARLLNPTNPDEMEYWDDALIVIENGKFKEVIVPDGRPVDRDLRPAVIVPGFVDSHLHFPQTRIVGSASGPLLDWLNRSTFPEEQRFSELSHAEKVAEIFATELASAGTTLPFVYGPVFPSASDALFRVLERRGQRAVVGPVWMDENCPDPLKLTPEASSDGIEALVANWHGKHDLLHVAVIPRFALSCSKHSMTMAAEVARKHRLHVSTHLSENPVECQIARDSFKATDYLSIYEDSGLLTPGSIYAHCIYLSDSELDRFARAGAVVAHCPDSNAFLGSGDMPTSAIAEREIPITIGTDIAAGRSFRVSNTLSYAYDNALRTHFPISTARLLWWGTRGGALALGFPQVGAIAPGLDADFQCIDVPEWAETAEGIVANLIFNLDAPKPRFTCVRGRTVWTRADVVAAAS